MSDSIPQAIAEVEAALADNDAKCEAQRQALLAGQSVANPELWKILDEARDASMRCLIVCKNHIPALLAAAKSSAEKDAEIERLRAENAKLREQVGHFSELADERHDLLSAERRKVDDLRAALGKGET